MKTSKYLFLGMVALAFAACNNEEVINDGPVAAQVSAGIEGVQTRAAGTNWDSNDQIGISCSGGKTTYTNVLYTVSDVSSGSFASDAPIYFQDLKEVTFSAYYPYAAAGGTIEKTITATDQEAEAQKKIDYMFASGAKASKQNPSVKFTNERDTDARFTHRMSQLSFTFNQGADTDLTNMADFTISGLKMEGTFNTENGTASVTNTAQAAELKITETPSASDTYTRSLILFPQQVENGKFNLSLTLGGETYKTELSVPNGGTDLTAGNKYTYTITVKKTEIVVSQSSIEGWGDGGDGNGTAEM
ncbi:MAG: fimbrillin family protein [Paraprevotella clara]|uniref:Fimbrillin-like protein n=1 Tax=Paraprevotella clara TaxID=454154 RepID=A0A6N2ZYP6_9BACT